VNPAILQHCFFWFGNTGADAAIAILLLTLKRFSCNGAVDWSTKCFCCERVSQNRRQFCDRSTLLHFTPLCYTSLHFITLHSTLLNFTPLYWTSLHIITLHCTLLHFTALYYTSLHFIALHSTLLHFTPLYYTSLYYTSLHFSTLVDASVFVTQTSVITAANSLHLQSLHYQFSHVWPVFDCIIDVPLPHSILNCHLLTFPHKSRHSRACHCHHISLRSPTSVIATFFKK
jgi:hypothetical protein